MEYIGRLRLRLRLRLSEGSWEGRGGLRDGKDVYYIYTETTAWEISGE